MVLISIYLVRELGHFPLVFCLFVCVLFLDGFIFLDYFTLLQRTIVNINLTLYGMALSTNQGSYYLSVFLPRLKQKNVTYGLRNDY